MFFTCKNCEIKAISTNIFIDTPYIQLLDLSFNKIKSESLYPAVFRGQHLDENFSPLYLQTLDISHNSVEYLDEKLFEHTPYLRKITLSYNQLKELSGGTLRALKSCKNLEVSYDSN